MAGRIGIPKQETNMTAIRNTTWAFGLMLLALASGKAALGASASGCGGSSCDATCSPSGNASCDTPCNAPGESACRAAPDAGCGAACTAGNPHSAADGLRFAQLEDDPVLEECRQFFKDFCETCAGCSWKADASALFLHRSTPGSRTVLLDPTTGADLYDANRQEFPYAAGPRVSLTVLDCEGWGLELNYFGVDGWSTTSNVPRGGDLLVDNSPISPISPLPLSSAQFASIARFYSTEVNFRRPLFGNFSALAGFRWLEMTDQYSASGVSTTGYAVSETILTHNHLYGFQIGADGTLYQEPDRWRITGFVKGGIFLNNAEQATSLSDPDPRGPGSSAVNTSLDAAAFFGETGIVGYFQITKHLSVRSGYEVMFVNNVAQPVNQIPNTNLASRTATVDTSAGLFYQGASAGLEVTW